MVYWVCRLLLPVFLFPGISVVVVLVRSSSKVHTHTCRSVQGLYYLHSFGLCVQARGVKAVCVDARCVCRVWAGCRRGQNVCVPRVLQAARWPNAAQAAHTATALSTYTHNHTRLGFITTILFFHVVGATSRYLPAVCAAPRCPHWCCSAVQEWESPEDSALQSGSLTHTHKHTRARTHTRLLLLIGLQFFISYYTNTHSKIRSKLFIISPSKDFNDTPFQGNNDHCTN